MALWSGELGIARADGAHPAKPEVIEAHGHAEIVVPGAGFIVHAEYARVGHDLVLTGDGREVVVRGFFDTDHPPSLVTGEGAQISGALAARLAGPLAPGELAQAGPATGTGSAPIGHVQVVSGVVTARHADGTTTTLTHGAPVFQGDVLHTAAGASMGVVFVDKTTFTLGGDARMVLDRLVFDPNSHAGSAAFSLLQGAFVAVTGEIGKLNHSAVRIDTPVGSIGIRGTQFACQIANTGGQSTFTLLQGAILVTTGAGSVLLDSPGLSTVSTGLGAALAAPFVLPASQQALVYGAVIELSHQLAPFQVNEGRPENEHQGGENQNQPSEVPAHDAPPPPPPPPPPEIPHDPLSSAPPPPPPPPPLLPPPPPPSGPDQGAVLLQVASHLITGTGGPDLLYGTIGDDTIDGAGGNDTIHGGDGNDLIIGGTGNDVLLGEGGNDTFLWHAGDGNDTIDGGTGNDSSAVIGDPSTADSISIFTEQLGHAAVFVTDSYGSETLDLTGVESILVEGGAGNDYISIGYLAGTGVVPGGLVVLGGAGNDTIDGSSNTMGFSAFGGDGNDSIVGGSGNDVLAGGPGADTLAGGAGNDTYLYNYGDGADTINEGTDTLSGGIDKILFGGVPDGAFSSAVQSGSNLVITLADGGAVTIVGQYAGTAVESATDLRTGETYMLGTLDNESASTVNTLIAGTSGADTLVGGSGDDLIMGNGGNDVITGGLGQDQLEGDGGANTYIYNSSADGTDISTNRLHTASETGDTINDFVPGTDKIQLVSTGFNVAIAATLTNGVNFSTISTSYDGTNPGANSNYASATGTLIYSTADQTLYYDGNGSAAGYTVVATFHGSGIVLHNTDITVPT